jgi:hypothetical protein
MAMMKRIRVEMLRPRGWSRNILFRFVSRLGVIDAVTKMSAAISPSYRRRQKSASSSREVSCGR